MIIRNFNLDFHCYADDTQIYLGTKSTCNPLLTRTENAVCAVKSWLTYNLLDLSADKAELFLTGARPMRNKHGPISLPTYNVTIAGTQPWHHPWPFPFPCSSRHQNLLLSPPQHCQNTCDAHICTVVGFIVGCSSMCLVHFMLLYSVKRFCVIEKCAIKNKCVFRVGLCSFFLCGRVCVPNLPLCTLAFEHNRSLRAEDIPVLECVAAAGGRTVGDSCCVWRETSLSPVVLPQAM